MRLGPVILFTPAFDESLDFYAALLGIDPERRGPGFAEFPLDGGVFALHRADVPAVSGGPLHLHFTTEDLEPVLARALAVGIHPVEGPSDEPWGREATFSDPAGFRSEVTAPLAP